MAPSASVPAELRAPLDACLEEARVAYPEIGLPDELFFAHVLDKLAEEDGTELTGLRTTELYLARAAAAGDPAALRYLERDVLVEIDAAYRRFPDCPAPLEDVKQRLREKLLLAQEPGILGYAGTGALRGWVRSAALHMLLNIVQREAREEPTDAALLDVVIGFEPSAEAAYLKLACREELESALAFAMQTLESRERSLLRHAFVDRRTVDEIGAIYGVHRASAARWVAAARTKLVEQTRADLVRRLGISATEANSIIAAALSGVGSMLIAKLGRP